MCFYTDSTIENLSQEFVPFSLSKYFYDMDATSVTAKTRMVDPCCDAHTRRSLRLSSGALRGVEEGVSSSSPPPSSSSDSPFRSLSTLSFCNLLALLRRLARKMPTKTQRVRSREPAPTPNFTIRSEIIIKSKYNKQFIQHLSNSPMPNNQNLEKHQKQTKNIHTKTDPYFFLSLPTCI